MRTGPPNGRGRAERGEKFCRAPRWQRRGCFARRWVATARVALLRRPRSRGEASTQVRAASRCCFWWFWVGPRPICVGGSSARAQRRACGPRNSAHWGVPLVHTSHHRTAQPAPARLRRYLNLMRFYWGVGFSPTPSEIGVSADLGRRPVQIGRNPDLTWRW